MCLGIWQLSGMFHRIHKMSGGGESCPEILVVCLLQAYCAVLKQYLLRKSFKTFLQWHLWCYCGTDTMLEQSGEMLWSVALDIGDAVCSVSATDCQCCRSVQFKSHTYMGWLGSRVISMLDSGAVGPGFKLQPRHCRVTVLGKLFTPIVPLFNKQQNW